MGSPYAGRFVLAHGPECFDCSHGSKAHERFEMVTTNGLLFRLELPGQLPSGKNRIIVTRTGKRIPDKRFVQWRQAMLRLVSPRPGFPHEGPVLLRVWYTPGNLIRRDVDGMLGAIMHLLEKGGWLLDDALVKDVDWKTLPLDRENPRAVVECY